MIVSRRQYNVSLPRGGALVLGQRTLVMGVINVTPDSFTDGGLNLDPEHSLSTAIAFEKAGVDLLDVGGESTRPGASPLSATDECKRVLPVIERIAERVRVPVSIDTYKADVARLAIECGASIVNDISALRSGPEIAEVAAASGAPIVLMHSRGSSRKMYEKAYYSDIVAEVTAELGSAVKTAMEAGVSRDQIIVDPGFGFAKRSDQTLRILAHLPSLACLDRPILVGPSRKSFLGVGLGERLPLEREWGTAAAVAAAAMLGAHIVRVHAVEQHLDVVRVIDSIRTQGMSGVSENNVDR